MSALRPPLLGVNVEHVVQVQAYALELGQAGGNNFPGTWEDAVLEMRYEALSAVVVREVYEAIPLVP